MVMVVSMVIVITNLICDWKIWSKGNVKIFCSLELISLILINRNDNYKRKFAKIYYESFELDK